MRTSVIVLVTSAVLAVCVSTVEARGRRWSGGGGGGYASLPMDQVAIWHDGLPLVNKLRVARGLRPFIFDRALQRNAWHQAVVQARTGMYGHHGCIMSDVMGNGAEGCGPATANCDTADGWHSCCWLEDWKYAAAAYVDIPGSTTRFCTIHVRN